jgi:RNA polymerase sigma-70 factor (ECF subfamily)
MGVPFGSQQETGRALGCRSKRAEIAGGLRYDAAVDVAAARTRFLATLEPSAHERFAAWPQLGPRLEQLYREASSTEAWSDGERFAAFVAAHVDDDGEPEPALADIHAADALLACGCADGNPRALAQFEREYGRDIDLAIARSGDIGLTRDEFRQRVRERLFVAGPDRAARIAAYGGRGTLRAWVRVTATRVMLDWLRRRAEPQHRPSDDAAVFDHMAGPADPELDYMRRIYGAAVPEAMQSAFAALTPRQRNLLRQRYVHQLPSDRLAIVYRVHRATAFRWLEDARAALWQNLRSALAQRLRIADAELDSVIAMIASRVDVSFRGLLASQLEGER